MPLNEEQKKQVEEQLLAHKHGRYEADIVLAEGYVLHGFVVHPEVLRPEVMTSEYLASYLFSNNSLYRSKVAIDMGCGSGIQGVVMGLNGAKEVLF